MGDVYEEQLIRRKTPQKYKIYVGCLIALTVLLALLSFLTAMILFFVPAVFVACLAYYFSQRWDLEFEYIYVNGELDIDKIMAKSSRKRVVSVDMQNLEVMAPVGSHGLDSFRNLKCAEYDCTSYAEDAQVYALITTGEDGERVRILFEPNEKIVSAIRRISPRKVLPY